MEHLRRWAAVVATVVGAVAAVATLLLLLSNTLDGKFAASEARQNQAMGQLRTEINARFDDINNRFDDINGRFDDVNGRLDRMDRRQEERFNRMESLLLKQVGAAGQQSG